MAKPLVLINVFDVPAEEAERFIAAWEKTHDYLKSQPGYIDTPCTRRSHRMRTFSS